MKKSILLYSLFSVICSLTLTVNGQTNAAADLLKTFTDRIEIHGYAQGGYDYNTTTNENSFNFKRTVVWAKAKITDKWSFLFMHDFNSKPLEYYTDFRPCKAI